MLCRVTVCIYYENHTEHTNALYGQNEEILHLKRNGRRGYH
jgi:hypothetical protein